MPEGITFRKPAINGAVFSITALVIVLSQLNYAGLASIQYALLILGTLIIGIPHGATDDHIFQQTGLQDQWLNNWFSFYGLYILMAALYGGLWYVWPSASLAFFLLISIYHFGQSQLFYIDTKYFWLFKFPFYLFWGGYVLFLPLIFSYDEALPIIQELIGFQPLNLDKVSELALPIAALLLVLNLSFLTGANWMGNLGKRSYLQEVLNLGVLGLLAYTTPLFVAFITYWALWHSFNSMIEITTFLTRSVQKLDVKGFYKRALPLSVITFIGIGLIFWLTQSHGSRESMIAIFFIIIAAVTLPHTLLMDVLYKEKLKANDK